MKLSRTDSKAASTNSVKKREMTSQLPVDGQALLEIAKCTNDRHLRRTARKRKEPAAGRSLSSSSQFTPPQTSTPVIELDRELPEDREQVAADPYIIPKLPLSALDVPSPAGEMSISALRQTKRLVHHCECCSFWGREALKLNI